MDYIYFAKLRWNVAYWLRVVIYALLECCALSAIWSETVPYDCLLFFSFSLSTIWLMSFLLIEMVEVEWKENV